MTWLMSLPKSVKLTKNYMVPPTCLCNYHNKQCQVEVLIVKPLDFIHRLDQYLELYTNELSKIIALAFMRMYQLLTLSQGSM